MPSPSMIRIVTFVIFTVKVTKKLLQSLRFPAMGSYQSGQMGQTVNLLALAFGGSNPSLPTFIYGKVHHYPTFLYMERSITTHFFMYGKAITAHFFIYGKVLQYPLFYI